MFFDDLENFALHALKQGIWFPFRTQTESLVRQFLLVKKLARFGSNNKPLKKMFMPSLRSFADKHKGRSSAQNLQADHQDW